MSERINAIVNIEYWEDEQALVEDGIDILLLSAKQIKGRSVFVHCKRGLLRTPTFIAIAELFARDPAEIRRKSSAEIKQLIFNDLVALSKTAIERMPTLPQLEMLFSDTFIEKVKSSV